MILFFFGVLLAGAAAGPDEDTADKILSAFVRDNGGKSVATSNFVYPYKLSLGILTTSLEVRLTNGQMNLDNFIRLGPVDTTQGFAFSAQIDAKLSYKYNFQSSVPGSFAEGTTTISWQAPVSLVIGVDENNKASLGTITLLRNGTMTIDVVPYVAGRTATLYPKGNSEFAPILFISSLQDYLTRTFKNISF